jgi:hypothetical protein
MPHSSWIVLRYFYLKNRLRGCATRLYSHTIHNTPKLFVHFSPRASSNKKHISSLNERKLPQLNRAEGKLPERSISSPFQKRSPFFIQHNTTASESFIAAAAAKTLSIVNWKKCTRSPKAHGSSLKSEAYQE